MSSLEQNSDSALFSLAKECEGGVDEILGHFFGFLARQTKFFTNKTEDECCRDVMKAYDRQIEKMEAIVRQRRRERDEEESRHRKLVLQKLAMEKAKKEEEDKKKNAAVASNNNVDGLLMPNEGNGCDLPKYSWTQTLDKIEIIVPFEVDFKLKSRDVLIAFQKNHLKVGIRGRDPVIDGDLFGEILLFDQTTWTLTDQKTASIQLIKKRSNQFWSKLVQTDPAINIKN